MATRVDYERTAAILKEARERYESTNDANAHVGAIANDFARVFKGDNPRFDAAKFRKACGLPPS